MYGAPSLDGATVKATLDGRGAPASNPEDLARELTDAEVAESRADRPRVPARPGARASSAPTPTRTSSPPTGGH